MNALWSIVVNQMWTEVVYRRRKWFHMRFACIMDQEAKMFTPRGPPWIFLRCAITRCKPLKQEGALGPIRNRKTVGKIIPTEKPKQIDQNRKPHAKLSKPIHFQTPVFKPDTMVTSGAHRVNYTNFITIFVNAMDWALLSSSICLSYMLYFSCSLEDLERGLCGLNS